MSRDLSDVAPAASQSFDRDDRIRLLILVVLIGFVAAVVFHYVVGFYLGKPWPFNSFLFDPGARFSDFDQIFSQSVGRTPYNPAQVGGAGCYFPFTYLLVFPLTCTFSSYLPALEVYLVGLVAFALWFGCRVFRISSRLETFQSAVIGTMLTYPFLFLLDRGNLEGLVFVFLALFSLDLLAERHRRAAVWLAMASAIKGYPLVFVLLLLRRRRFRESAFCVSLFVALTLVALASFRGTIASNWVAFMRGLGGIKELSTAALGVPNQDLPYHMIKFSCSLFGIVKYWVLSSAGGIAWRVEGLRNMLDFYLIGVAVLGAVMSFWVVFDRKLEDWEAVALIYAMAQLFPNVSFDYKLILVLVPLSFFLDAKMPRARALLVTLLFAFFLVPKGYLLLPGGVPLSSVLNPLVMVLACVGLAGRRMLLSRHAAQMSSVSSPVLDSESVGAV